MAKQPGKQTPPTDPVPTANGDPFASELAKRVGALVPTGQRDQVIAQVTSLVTEERFSGPIPHPRHLAEYDKIVPGSAAQIIQMAHDNLCHNQNLQSQALSADIDDTREGRRLGFAALVILMVGAIVCGLVGKDAIALAMLGATVVGTIGRFIQGRAKSAE